MKKEKHNNSSYLKVALIILIIAYSTNFFTTDKTIRNLKDYNTRSDEQFNEARIVSFKNGYYKGVINILENGTYSELRFKQDSIKFINILKQ